MSCSKGWFNAKEHDWEAIAGPNTKQLWAYCDDEDVLCDVPIDVLKECKMGYEVGFRNWDIECKLLQDILDTKPDWLNDYDHWYDGDIDI